MNRRASYFFLLAALLWLGGLPAFAHRPQPLKTRVGEWAVISSGQSVAAGVQSPESARGFWACAYKTASGRFKWLNQDPIGERGGFNLYVFVGNNPINYIDPLGLQEAEPDAPPAEPAPILYPHGAMPAEELMREEDNLLRKGSPSDTAIGPRSEDVKPAGNCPKGSVYSLRDAANSVMYVGRSSNLRSRQLDWARDAAKGQYGFSPLYRSDNYSEQRGLEQLAFNQYKPPLNINNPISPGNPNCMNYMSSAQSYINNPK